MAPRNFTFKGLIASHILQRKSYVGQPQNRNQELELSDAEVAAMDPKMIGTKLCYNHDGGVVAGAITSTELVDVPDLKNPGRMKKGWMVSASMPLDKSANCELADWVDKGLLRGLSLKHMPHSNTPVEVSLCFRGAREGTNIKSVMYEDSNSGLYRHSGTSQHSIAASATEDALEELEIFPLQCISASYTDMSEVAAPAAAPAQVAAPPPAAVAQPAAVAAPVAQQDDPSVVFPISTQITSLLGHANSIPTSDARNKTLEAVTQLELASKKMQMDMAEMTRKFEEEKVAIRAQAEAEARDKYVQSQDSEMKRRLAGDFLQTFAAPGANVDTIMASFTPEQINFHADAGAKMKKALAAAPPAADVEMEVEEKTETEVQKAMKLWKNMKTTTTHTPAPAAAAPVVMASYNSGRPDEYRSLLPAHVVAASARTPERAPQNDAMDSIASTFNTPEWGKPCEFRASNYAIAASSGAGRGNYNYMQPVKDAGRFLPGAGPRFYHGFMWHPGQIAIYHMAPENGTNTNCMNRKEVCSKEGLAEQEAKFARSNGAAPGSDLPAFSRHSLENAGFQLPLI